MLHREVDFMRQTEGLKCQQSHSLNALRGCNINEGLLLEKRVYATVRFD
jgi:hypothetical protein